MNNAQIADHLQTIAFLFTKQKEPWKSLAFNKVSLKLRVHDNSIVRDGRYIGTIPGVGTAIKDVIEQFTKTGTSAKLEKLRALFPDETVERFDTSICKKKIDELLQPLTSHHVDWSYAGSLRRGSPTVKDIDVIVCFSNETKERTLIDEVLKKTNLKADVRNGQEKIGISIPIPSYEKPCTLDLNFCHPENKGAMQLYFTGSKNFNIKQRGDVKAHGMLLNQHGLWQDGICIASRKEEDIFKALGCPFVAPADRL